ncbi:MAG: hypothetical protein ACT4PK_04640 [Gammaproteobacteria bacterium]
MTSVAKMPGMAPIRVLAIASLLAGALAPAAAQAKDEQWLFDLATVMGSAQGRDRFDDTVRFYWSGQSAPGPAESLSIQTSERKTFLPMRTEREACDLSFIEALASLRNAARKAGANAVVEVKSLYKNREFRSATEYECRVGYFSASVTLEGTLAKAP